MGWFKKDQLIFRISIRREYFSDEKKVDKLLAKIISLTSNERAYLRTRLREDTVGLYVSVKELNNFAKLRGKKRGIHVHRVTYDDREEGTNRKMR
jgi:hypothetical protein